MLNLFQHLIKSNGYETLKRVQGDKSGLFTRLSKIHLILSVKSSNIQGRLIDNIGGTGEGEGSMGMTTPISWKNRSSQK